MFGKHCLKHWSSTQSSVTLSSGEAEFHGLVKGAAVSLGQQALFADLGVHVPVRLWTDSSAAIGITSRQGLGKLRHVDTKTLWLQQAARTGKVEIRKVAGLVNPADLLTKYSLAKERISELIRLLGCYFGEGRPVQAPALREGQVQRLTMAEAEQQGLTAAITEAELGMPIMPHLSLSCEQLDDLYPAMLAPPEADDPDMDQDAEDLVYSEGMKIADRINRDMVSFGRTRREGDRREGAGGATLSKDGAEGRSGNHRSDVLIALVVGCLVPGESPTLVSVDAASGLPRVGTRLAPAESPAAPELRSADAAPTCAARGAALC